MGGFLPILKGKKTSKLKPEFVIFDPLKGEKELEHLHNGGGIYICCNNTDMNPLAFATEVLYNVSPIYPETFLINAEVCSLLYILFIIAILLFIWLQISTVLHF